MYFNNDFSGYRYIQNPNGSIDRIISGSITPSEYHKGGWDFFEKNTSNKEPKNVKNIIIRLNEKKPIKIRK